MILPVRGARAAASDIGVMSGCPTLVLKVYKFTLSYITLAPLFIRGYVLIPLMLSLWLVWKIELSALLEKAQS